jgi:hypothetical protein
MAYSHDYYHDDPVELKVSTKKQKIAPILALVLSLVGGGFFLQTTLASNISLGSASPVEFGQGTLQTTACSGDTQLMLTPTSAFTNVAGAGSYKFSSVTVSGIPDSCWGNDFTINAYDNSSNTPLALFDSTLTSAVIYNNGGNFSRGFGSTGMTVASSAGTFTATLTVPVALASTVFRITIQSGVHAPSYGVGDAGPGGGFIYYVDEAGFSCGTGFTSTGSPTGGLCHYLEVAPAPTGSEPLIAWSGNTTTSVTTSDAIGAGYKNTLAMTSQSSTADKSGTASRAYAGGGKSDWYLPSKNELNQMCKWARGQAWTSNATVCDNTGTLNSATYGASTAGLVESVYWSSSETNATFAWFQYLMSDATYGGNQSTTPKTSAMFVRPVRAF